MSLSQQKVIDNKSLGDYNVFISQQKRGEDMQEILRQMLNILIDIASTLKHIEQELSEEKQHKVIKDAVHHALVGEKFTPKDF